MLVKVNPGHFLETKKWAYLCINNLKFYTVCYYCMPRWWLSKYKIQNKLQTTCFYLTWSFLPHMKVKRGMELISPADFAHDFCRKIFLWLHSISWPNSLPGCFYLLDTWEYLYGNCLLTSFWYPNQPLFSTWTNCREKTWERKQLLR